MKTFKLWEGEVPALLEGEAPPVLEYYPAKKKLGRGTAIICPGGAYVDRARHEGEGYAAFLNSIPVVVHPGGITYLPSFARLFSTSSSRS